MFSSTLKITFFNIVQFNRLRRNQNSRTRIVCTFLDEMQNVFAPPFELIHTEVTKINSHRSQAHTIRTRRNEAMNYFLPVRDEKKVGNDTWIATVSMCRWLRRRLGRKIFAFFQRTFFSRFGGCWGNDLQLQRRTKFRHINYYFFLSSAAFYNWSVEQSHISSADDVANEPNESRNEQLIFTAVVVAYRETNKFWSKSIVSYFYCTERFNNVRRMIWSLMFDKRSTEL